MKQILTHLGLIVLLAVAGCRSMQHAEVRERPTGLPAEAKLIGGGLLKNGFSIPADGLVVVVDPRTNAAVFTHTVAAGEKVELSPEDVAIPILMARYGVKGIAFFEAATSGRELESLPTDGLTVEIYFVPNSVILDTPSATQLQ